MEISPEDRSGRTVAEDAIKADLWYRAVPLLESRLESRPDDLATVEKLADLCRRTGNLRRAADLYRSLSERRPNHPIAAYLAALLGGEELPARSLISSRQPAPFIRIEQFLPQRQRNSLMEIALGYKDSFEPLGVGSISRDGSLHVDPNEALRRQLGVQNVTEAASLIVPRVNDLLPLLFSRLDVEPFPVRKVHVAVTMCRDGHFGAPHSDIMDGRARISFLYYFHKRPKAFDGGDLLLYDGPPDAEGESGFDACTRVNHEDNVFIAFPCQYLHEITRVISESDAFEDGRFAASGFLIVR